nr:heme lyase CcmF/NrfE family subunit [Candidatus Endolissoclinum faulkneri]
MELGHMALVIALVVSVFQTIIPLYGTACQQPRLISFACPAAIVQFTALVLSFGSLINAFVASDFSVANVVDNSSSLKPMLYKVAGVWGNHEGSMLLWVLILSFFGASVAIFGANLPEILRARVIAIQGLIGASFLTFIIFTSNPFVRMIPAPIDGRGLNPLLQDIGLALHPPILYLGYVGLSTTFSFAVAALLEGRVSRSWARWVRPWILAAWVALTAGITLGSIWSYYELGWGGWWFWDPVENASFMPWLVATALLHSVIVLEKRNALKRWTVLLALVAFAFSLLGTFLVRSGVLTSVHSFAVDSQRGIFMLVLLSVTIVGSLFLYAWRAPAIESSEIFFFISREGALITNNLFMITGATTVLIGTIYPLFLESISGEKISVGPPFFESTFVPLMVPLILAVGVGPFLTWKRDNLVIVVKNVFFATVCLFMVFVFLWGVPIGAMFGLALAVWLMLSVLTEWAHRVRLFRVSLFSSLSRALVLPRSAYGMSIAHFGLAVFIFGAVGNNFYSTEVVRYASPGEKIKIAGHTLTFQSVNAGKGVNYDSYVGKFVMENGQVIESERRFFPIEGQQTTEVGLCIRPLGDIYTVLGEAVARNKWTIRIYYNAFVVWIWIGSFLMSLGGLLSFLDSRLRIRLQGSCAIIR